MPELFVENRRNTVCQCNELEDDEATSAIRHQTTPKANLLHMLLIIHKPEDLGTELKCTIDTKTWIMLALEIVCSRLDPSSREFVDRYEKDHSLLHLLVEAC